MQVCGHAELQTRISGSRILVLNIDIALPLHMWAERNHTVPELTGGYRVPEINVKTVLRAKLSPPKNDMQMSEIPQTKGGTTS